MSDPVAMESEGAQVELLPAIGGAVGAFDLKRGSESVSVMRRWAGKDDPRTVACSPMVPWFNRISGGGFTFDGTFYPIAPNDPIEPVPIHGDGWYSLWTVAEHSPERAVLTLRSQAIPPFDYEATQTFKLSDTTLEIELKVKHCGKKPIPYGLGFHPWFDRTPGVRIEAPATGVWLEQPPAFPESPDPAPIPAKWDFSKPSPLPDDFFDNGFARWNGHARIDWTDRGLALDVDADPAIHLYHAYSLGKDHDVFCFEPVTHANNALGKPGGPEANHLRVLALGEETSLTVRFAAKLR